MSTYEEFMIILTSGLLIVAILNLKNKKQPSCPNTPERVGFVYLPAVLLNLLYQINRFCQTKDKINFSFGEVCI